VKLWVQVSLDGLAWKSRTALSTGKVIVNLGHVDRAGDRKDPAMGDQNLLVSVCLITYQHAPFIRQALESVLAQATSFPVEICIGEDDSTDGTREICQEYARSYPDRIRLFLRDRHDVVFVNGRPTGRRNLVETIRACRGRYIALLEGDDYWTSNTKLQSQVEYLEHNPEVALCSHAVEYVTTDGAPYTLADPLRPATSCLSTLEILEGMPVHTSSLVLRSWEEWTFPEWFFTLSMGDWPLAVLCSLRGRVDFIPETMSAYRLHEGGRWSTLDSVEQMFANEQFYETMLTFLGSTFRRDVKRHLYRTRAHREYLRHHLWRSRAYKYLSALQGGPGHLLDETGNSIARVLRRLARKRTSPDP